CPGWHSVPPWWGFSSHQRQEARLLPTCRFALVYAQVPYLFLFSFRVGGRVLFIVGELSRVVRGIVLHRLPRIQLWGVGFSSRLNLYQALPENGVLGNSTGESVHPAGHDIDNPNGVL